MWFPLDIHMTCPLISFYLKPLLQRGVPRPPPPSKISTLSLSGPSLWFFVSFMWSITIWYYTCICVRCATPWTVALQAPLNMEFSMKECWSGLPFPIPRDLPNPGIKPMSLASPTLPSRLFSTAPSGKTIWHYNIYLFIPFLCFSH